jgi:hypothetical protein
MPALDADGADGGSTRITLRPRDFKSPPGASAKSLITDENVSDIKKPLGKQRQTIAAEGY